MNRCPWCTCNDKMIRYHDEEWGVPLHDDQKQFEFLMMEVMQCGLNWNMMIQKREIFRKCFEGFDFEKVAEYEEKDIERIMNTEGISDRVSADLKKRGMKYMGSITVYSHLQACGMINDHQESCFRYQEIVGMSDAVHKRRDKE